MDGRARKHFGLIQSVVSSVLQVQQSRETVISCIVTTGSLCGKVRIYKVYCDIIEFD